ncbi:hypothetical protein ABE525_06345 [Pseudomonas wadenswilerensis]|jgi:glycine/D-amino acid oxidase-like deaminating enzyme|uniref:Uncharacterized protein n=1 Tax=Pseudomonas wadenswilerensis TaxID=1785161 RepID=A0A380SZJ9_9PSED|nr:MULTISPECIES: hypothetical protein [Pseudomonas]MCE5985380.1 hypothetical protein [Pseudomonas sp. LF19]UVM20180.1 hypothetical protein LOY45_17175 [Pseudomonas wadenswilerensis]SPO67165.1 conserved protein of unknown function [Pseudomonas sp. JV241A]SUQ62656.1 hypothetical protein CCOS864_02102 [Pseudomonas wadenswilerensis]
MAGFSAVSINGTPLNSGINTGITVTGQERQAGMEAAGVVSVDLSKVRDSGKAEEAKEKEDAGAGEEPAHIKQLREMIKKMQKQLAEQQKRLQEAMASDMEPVLKATAVAAAQSAVGATTASIANATAALLKALTEAGGSSSGSLVSTNA